ncbi:MAG: alpha/beta fold hydrolase [Pseudomonadota bacterium]
MDLPSLSSLSLSSGRVTFLQASGADTAPVLLLHGGGLDAAGLSWRYLLPRIAGTRSVIALNWPGYGGSDPLGRPYTIADLGRWLIMVLDALEIERADIVGVSMGGGAGLWLAVNQPERVGRIVPVAAYGLQRKVRRHLLSYLMAQLPLNRLGYAAFRRSRESLRRSLEAIFADPARLTEEIVDEVEALLRAGASAAPFTHFQRGELRPRGLATNLADHVASLPHRTLFIHGRADRLVPLADIRAVAARMPQAKLVEMDVGHWPMRECPDAFDAHVVKFLGDDAI